MTMPQREAQATDTWLTPRKILDQLGEFGGNMKITKNIATFGGVMLGLSAFLLCVNILSVIVGETLYADMAYVAGCAVIGVVLLVSHALSAYMQYKSHRIEYQDVKLADILD